MTQKCAKGQKSVTLGRRVTNLKNLMTDVAVPDLAAGAR